MNEFPKTTFSARSGESGVHLVAYIISNSFGWLFRRNHDETDVGIDGFIDIVESDGNVTGKCLAVQIKHGNSYLKTKTEDGYTYYGNIKHINYFANYPIPVLIIVCDPESKVCFWEKFDLSITEGTDSGWKMCIPFDQTLISKFRTRLKEMAGSVIDYQDQLKAYWAINDKISADSSHISCVIDREDIEKFDFTNIIKFFERLQVTKKIARQMQGKVDIFIFGYDLDERELWQIPDVIKWFDKAESLIKYWFFFLSLEEPTPGLFLLTCCRCKAKWIQNPKATLQEKGVIEFDRKLFSKFLRRNFMWLNELTERLNISDEENKRISITISNRFVVTRPSESP